jgi:hypothetical protein
MMQPSHPRKVAGKTGGAGKPSGGAAFGLSGKETNHRGTGKIRAVGFPPCRPQPGRRE